MNSISELLEQGLAYIRLGWAPVILHGLTEGGHCTCQAGPNCTCPGKHPRQTGWQLLPSPTPQTLQLMLEALPCSNLGLRLGPISGVVDCEFDTQEGETTARRLLQGYLATPSYTSARSTHRLYCCPPEGLGLSKAVYHAAGLELRLGTDAKGAQSVVPPSRHASGVAYAWLPGLSPFEVQSLPFPEPLAALLSVNEAGDPGDGRTFVMEADLQTHPGEAEGGRNPTLCRLVGQALAAGEAVEKVLEQALAWNQRCQPPKPADKIQRTVFDLAAKHLQAQAQQTQPATCQLIVRRGDVIQPEAVQWLWPGRIPLGKLTLLVGLGEAGKTFVSCDAMARLSRGESFPGCDIGILGESAIATAEDGLADTIRPRLDAHGADPTRWYAIELVKQGEKLSSLTLQTHCAVLEDWLRQHPEVRLLVLDPLSAYLGNVNSYSDAEVRSVLHPLKEVAERQRVAVIGISHLTKREAKVVQRVSGSIAFINAARCAWYVAKDPDDEDESRRLFLRTKGNLADMAKSGLAFSIVNGRVAWEDAPVFIAADDIESEGKAEPTKRREAEAWLVQQLAGGEGLAADLYKAAERAGFSRRTLERARRELDIRTYRKAIPGPWYWTLQEGGDRYGF